MAQSLRWMNSSASTTETQRIRITTGNCTTASASCSANDTYRVRAYETTYAIPRFNQTGSQVSVVILQNPISYPIAVLRYSGTPVAGY